MIAHEVLGLAPTASKEEIKAAYRKLAAKHHPDRGGDQETFKKINVAYEQMMNGPVDDGKFRPAPYPNVRNVHFSGEFSFEFADGAEDFLASFFSPAV